MKKWLLTCSIDAVDIDYEITIESETEPDWWTCENIAREHGCEWWSVEEIKGENNMENIENYFGTCVSYWMSTGCSEGVATVRALWWDCVEVWNMDKSWTEDKVKFINRYRKYKPYDPVPESDEIEKGAA